MTKTCETCGHFFEIEVPLPGTQTTTVRRRCTLRTLVRPEIALRSGGVCGPGRRGWSPAAPQVAQSQPGLASGAPTPQPPHVPGAWGMTVQRGDTSPDGCMWCMVLGPGPAGCGEFVYRHGGSTTYVVTFAAYGVPTPAIPSSLTTLPLVAVNVYSSAFGRSWAEIYLALDSELGGILRASHPPTQWAAICQAAGLGGGALHSPTPAQP